MSEADIQELLTFLKALFTTSVGKEFDRITSGTTTDNDKVYYAIVAINDTATLGSNTTTIGKGDSPDGDDIQQDVARFGTFDDIQVTSGTVYAYYRTEG
jgi:hypothetical protein